MPKRDFETLLLQAIDEALSSLGESSKQAIYFHLEKGFRIEKQEIPSKIGAFTCAIERIFGEGASFLEILIMKKLYEKVGRSLKWQSSENLEFTEYIAVVEQSFQEKSIKKSN